VFQKDFSQLIVSVPEEGEGGGGGKGRGRRKICSTSTGAPLWPPEEGRGREGKKRAPNSWRPALSFILEKRKKRERREKKGAANHAGKPGSIPPRDRRFEDRTVSRRGKEEGKGGGGERKSRQRAEQSRPPARPISRHFCHWREEREGEKKQTSVRLGNPRLTPRSCAKRKRRKGGGKREIVVDHE